MGSLNTFAKDYFRHASALVKLSRDMLARGMDPARLANPDNSFVSAQQDHIALWKSTYSGFRLFIGEKHFVLGQSGHIAGIINPPDPNKYGYYVNDAEEETPERWFDDASHHEGSWWPHWQDWVSRFQGKEVAPRVPGDNALDVIEDAPGSYVKVRLV